jgi:Domain of unknown function (DUF6457)
MSTLQEWTAAVGADLGLGPAPLATADTKVVLDLAREAAHGVDRLAAPLTALPDSYRSHDHRVRIVAVPYIWDSGPHIDGERKLRAHTTPG